MVQEIEKYIKLHVLRDFGDMRIGIIFGLQKNLVNFRPLPKKLCPNYELMRKIVNLCTQNTKIIFFFHI
jgi:hypothetical protein